jgi:hypothetical protein
VAKPQVIIGVFQNGQHFINHPPTTLVVSTRDHQDAQAVKVIPVIDKRTKRSRLAFLNVYQIFFDVCNEALKDLYGDFLPGFLNFAQSGSEEVEYNDVNCKVIYECFPT